MWTGVGGAAYSVLTPSVVPPAVPAGGMTGVSRFAAESIISVGPTPKSTLAALILSAPAAESAARVVAACNRKSRQLLSVSAPSGKRPALLLVAPVAGPPRPPGPLPALGDCTLQPPCPAPEAAW